MGRLSSLLPWDKQSRQYRRLFAAFETTALQNATPEQRAERRSQLHDLFASRTWYGLDYETKCDAVQALEQDFAFQQGRPAKKVVVGPVEHNYYGGWYPNQNVIRLNKNLLKHGNLSGHPEDRPMADANWQIFDTIAHEGYHAYQTYALENPDAHADKAQLREWALNEGYYFQNGNHYLIQPQERDAWRYGHSATLEAFRGIEARNGPEPSLAKEKYNSTSLESSYDAALARAQKANPEVLRDMEQIMERGCQLRGIRTEFAPRNQILQTAPSPQSQGVQQSQAPPAPSVAASEPAQAQRPAPYVATSRPPQAQRPAPYVATSRPPQAQLSGEAPQAGTGSPAQAAAQSGPVIRTVPAASIDMTGAMGMNDPNFWNHHGHSREGYLALAEKLPAVQAGLAQGRSLDELRQDPQLSDCVNAYYSPSTMVKVYERPDGGYEYEDDGRHRILAAQELGCDIPVQVVNAPAYSQEAAPELLRQDQAQEQQQLQDQEQSQGQEQLQDQEQLQGQDQSQDQEQSQDPEQLQDQDVSMDQLTEPQEAESQEQGTAQAQFQDQEQLQDQEVSMDQLTEPQEAESQEQGTAQAQLQDQEQLQDQDVSMDQLSKPQEAESQEQDTAQAQSQEQEQLEDQDVSMDQLAGSQAPEENPEQTPAETTAESQGQDQDQSQSQDSAPAEDNSADHDNSEEQSQGYSY